MFSTTISRRSAEPGAVGGELARGSSRSPRAGRASVEQRRADVEQVHEHARALDVAQEAVAEAVALARALDQAGDVGDDEAALVRAATTPSAGTSVVNGIVRDARARGGDAREQRRLAGVREADQARRRRAA